MAHNDHKGPKQIGELLPPVRPLSRVHKRFLTMPLFEEGEDANIIYQHSVFCQTCMPYRNPGKDIRLWERHNGIVRLEIQAGRVLDPDHDAFVDVGLPFGPKPRLALYHLNAEALRTQSRVIELEDSLTASSFWMVRANHPETGSTLQDTCLRYLQGLRGRRGFLSRVW